MLKVILILTRILRSLDLSNLFGRNHYEVEATMKVVVTEGDLTEDKVALEEPLEQTKSQVNNEKPEPKREIQIIQRLLPSNQIMGKRKFIPTQICLHHTCSSTVDSVYRFWSNDNLKIGTNYVLSKNGEIYCFIKEYEWAYGLGIRFESNKIEAKYKTKEHSDKIEQLGIGIELVCEGELVLKENKYWWETGKKFIPEDQVVKMSIPYKGHKYFAKYTEAQINSLYLLIDYLTSKYPIKKEWIGHYDVSIKALNGESGIFSHVNFRSSGKSDIFPQANMELMLNNLKQ